MDYLQLKCYISKLSDLCDHKTEATCNHGYCNDNNFVANILHFKVQSQQKACVWWKKVKETNHIIWHEGVSMTLEDQEMILGIRVHLFRKP